MDRCLFRASLSPEQPWGGGGLAGSWRGRGGACLHRALEFPAAERKVTRVLPGGRGWCIGGGLGAGDAETAARSPPYCPGARRLGSHPAPRASCSEMAFGVSLLLTSPPRPPHFLGPSFVSRSFCLPGRLLRVEEKKKANGRRERKRERERKKTTTQKLFNTVGGGYRDTPPRFLSISLPRPPSFSFLPFILFLLSSPPLPRARRRWFEWGFSWLWKGQRVCAGLGSAPPNLFGEASP